MEKVKINSERFYFHEKLKGDYVLIVRNFSRIV